MLFFFPLPFLAPPRAGFVIFWAYTPPPRSGGGGVNNAAAAIVRRNSAVPVIFGREADKARAEMSVFLWRCTINFCHKFSVKY